MRIVLTGAAGFLGSHLTDRLIYEGHQVIGLDNFITGDEANIAHLFNNPAFQLIRQDVSTYIDIPGQIDYVMHFASPASPNPASPLGYPNLPIQTLKAGALGTLNTLGLAKAHRAKYLLASTSEVYGDPQIHPQPETYWGNCDPIGPRSVYDEAKRFAEALTMAYHRFHGVDTHIVRIFNTFGPRMRLDDGRVVPNFILQALHHQALTIYGSGEQTRSFCYVTDLVEGIFRLMWTDMHDPVNIGNPNETTIRDFALLINELTGNEAGTVTLFAEGLGDDPQKRQPDITRARELLNWEPQVDLRSGLRETIAYFQTKIG
ncbi:MAG TPA: SDR family oxidoreductase [Anaerolineaceae bacterium]|jgi:dTDP-glucose 4,6-dehydratase|nr:SDR family oxidoreductase [Anaerolineaceae bacterium]HOF24658.1 SDR family oxidoreductase [Anaerolineaceae bacterium]HOR77336.1 SDR family oxidoreductase [Anaerolineaceae bacterium]HPK26106.1 SDR family oxidoreductase [Anaerolineaceae bacterium]